MRRRTVAALAVFAALLFLLPAGSATADQVRAFPGISCKESPTPDMPGTGLATFFDAHKGAPPPQRDPFAPGSKATMYQQYGYAGLRWHTYDLGCGPDAARHPDAVIGTALSNWLMNIPIAVTALTSSLTQVAFHPTFLDSMDPVITRVSRALHNSLFATWIPAVFALLGIAILIKARRAALATTAAAVGWALIVVLIATALFRWPVAAGHFADGTVTSTLGTVVDGLDGHKSNLDPGESVASNVQESIFYRGWLAGTLGSTSSETAKKYGTELFKAQALTWHEAYVVQHDPQRGKQIIQDKEDRWAQLASQIKDTDPEAYENLTGKRSDTRIGYALLSSVAALLALPFLLIAALLLLGSFLIVRLAVMLFPAFATLGAFPAGRGVVLGIGRAVGAALVNSVIFGIGAAVTIRVLGLIFDPGSHMPPWLSLVLMPLFGFVMWVALKPFRRLTTMVSPHTDPFGDGASAFQNAGRSARRWARKATSTGVGVYTGNVAAAATVAAGKDDDASEEVPDRAEARPAAADPGFATTPDTPQALPPASATTPSGPQPDGPPRPSAGPAPAAPPPGYEERVARGADPDSIGGRCADAGHRTRVARRRRGLRDLPAQRRRVRRRCGVARQPGCSTHRAASWW